MSSRPGCNRFDHALAQIRRIGFRHPSPPAKENQCRQTHSSVTLGESFRFKFTGKCCSAAPQDPSRNAS
jgi:hypothetical protein